MSQFLGGGDHDESSLLDYEATLKALRSLIGRQVLPRRVRTGLLAATNKLTIHLGDCAITVMMQGELGEALRREQPTD